MLATMDRSRWVPENAEGATLLWQLPDGTKQYLLQRLRMELSPDGSLRRASDLLPNSRLPISAEQLPERLGGGHLFVVSGVGTSLWRSSQFLGKLSTLAKFPVSAVQVASGTDRILVRSVTGDRIWGIDPSTGLIGTPLPLPVAPRYGAMAFADAWRGAVYADLLGLMVTRDAGATWQKIQLESPPQRLTAEQGSRVIRVAWGGNDAAWVDLDSLQVSTEKLARPTPWVEKSSHRLWGALSPLRVALEDGWPLLDGTAVVFREGRISRVHLMDGKVLASSFSPVEGEEASTCTPIRFGADVGFACGASGQGTSLYVYAPPSGVEPVLKFDAPRRVVPSQNGWLVLHGRCDLEASGEPQHDHGVYCIISPTGGRREILTRGDIGVERIVALADGRVAVVIPPRGTTDGLVTLLPAQSGGAITTVQIQPGEDAGLLRRGLWLDGMYESSPGELGGWIEAGGVLIGVRIKLEEGSVLMGQPQEGAQLSVSGPLAMAVLGGDQLFESVDGGLSWSSAGMPASLEQGKIRPGLHCSVVGCVVPFERGTWLRVGWGQAADPTDLEDAAEVNPIPSFRTNRRALNLKCEWRAQQEIKEDKETPIPETSGRRSRFPRFPIPPAHPPAHFFPGAAPEPPEAQNGPLPSFFGIAPPQPPEGAIAISEGTASGASARVYGWVPRGVAAGRAGRIQVRFQDRFSPEHPIRSSRLTIAPWRDEQALQDAFGQFNVGVAFHGLLDPEGKAMLLASCQGTTCGMSSVVDGRPVVPLAQPEDEPFSRIFAPTASAVWHDETFFFAVNTGPQLEIWRTDVRRPHRIVSLPRVTNFNGQSTIVTLIRRVRGGALGLLAQGPGVDGSSDPNFFVLPLDPSTGKLGEMLHLGSTDLSRTPVRVCTPEDDGWLVTLFPSVYPSLQLPPGIRLGEVELRVRIEPNSICLDAAAAKLLDLGNAGKQTHAPSARSESKGFSMVASSSTRNVILDCRP